MTALASTATIYGASLALLVIMAIRAPFGWQDADGFHYGHGGMA